MEVVEEVEVEEAEVEEVEEVEEVADGGRAPRRAPRRGWSRRTSRTRGGSPSVGQPTPSVAIPERDYFVAFRRRGTNGKSLLTKITIEKKHTFLAHDILTHCISL